MSNHSNGSSSKSRFVSGIPKRCWCGSSVSSVMSNSSQNPNCRYYRCSFAAKEKLVDDEHVFKWIDEAIVNEIERIDREMGEMESKRVEQQQVMVEQLQVMIKNQITERVKVVTADSEFKMKKLVVCAMVISCMANVGLMKMLD